MKFIGLLIFTATLALAPATQAAQAVDAATGNPYLGITNRNVFALVPIPPVVLDTNPPVVGDPPPKITPNGIMSIFGQLQVLFKVAVPAKGKDPARDDSYMLAEGERQNGITVLKIDQATEKTAATITFDNHGTRQEIPLAAAPKTAPVASPITGGNGVNPVTGATPRTTALSQSVATKLARATGGAGGPAESAAPDLNNPASTGDSQIYNPAKHDTGISADPEVNAAKMALNYLETKQKDPAKAALFPFSKQDKDAIENLANPQPQQ